MEEIMTPSEVAALLKIHLKTVYELEIQQERCPGTSVQQVDESIGQRRR
jgi:hypothetical protein